MELRHLRYFVATAEALNFRVAAELLHLSTPGLSKQIKNLEEEIGTRLLDRDTTSVSLTNAGIVFLEESRRILALADRAGKLAREAARGRRGSLVVGNIGPLTASYMAATLAHYCGRYPDVDVKLVDMDVGAQIVALQQREIHVAFIPSPTLSTLAGDIRSTPILTTPLRVVVGDGHRLCDRPSISLTELQREKLLVVGGGRPALHGVYVNQLFTNRALKPPRLTEVQGFESLLAMIAGGQGVSILAGRGSIMRADNIVMLPLKETGADLDIEICAAWHDGESSLLARNFIAVFQNLARSRKSSARTLARPA